MKTSPVRTVTVYVAECDSENRKLTVGNLSAGEGIIVVGSTENGRDAVESVVRLRPEVLVVNTLLPELDGFEVVREVRERLGEYAPVTIVLSDYSTPAVMRDVSAYAVSYLFLRPIMGDRLCDAVRNSSLDACKSYSEEFDLANKVTELLLEIGIPAHLRGYQYVREAIILTVQEPELIDSVTKRLYPVVAKTYGTTPSKVERAMRHAIEVSCDRGDVDSFQRIFGYTVSMAKGKPTNSEFIAMLADHLSLHLRRNDGSRIFAVR